MVFSELSRGEVKNFCCDESLALDHDLVQLLQPEKNLLDLYRDVLAAHTNRLLAKLVQRSQNHPDYCWIPGYTYLLKVWKGNRSVLFRERLDRGQVGVREAGHQRGEQLEQGGGELRLEVREL